MNIEEELMLLGMFLIGWAVSAFWGYQLAKFRYYDGKEEGE